MPNQYPQIVLASASPRRRELLASVGIQFQVIPSNIDEIQQPDEKPEDFVLRLSREKAAEVAQRSTVSGRWFIGSDTIVQCDDHILGKPDSREDSASMLRMLSGRSHQVISGYAILDRNTNQWLSRSITTDVTFRALTDHEIDGYIASGEPADKAGSYAIQGLGAFMVTTINGSYSSVVGLPLAQIIDDLQQLDAFDLFAK
ncbi:MAG: septum formation protein Maf [Desulfuromonadales bacterium C00003068]|nr:MAG: septum formation protein Maf [Desulfuromonadales bacterium C00003068]